MLGEKIGEISGKTVGTRVLPHVNGARVEVSQQQTGKILGIEVTSLVTYQSTMRPGGTLHGEATGVMMSREGDNATFVGMGAGRPTGKGMAAQWRGAIYYETTSGKLARLNGMAVVFEYDVDENGNTQGRLYEWK